MGKFDEIVGYEYIKREFEDLAYTLEHSKELAARGVRIPRGLMLHGGIDRGKKFMANVFAEATGREIFYFDGFSDMDDQFKELAEFESRMTDEGAYLVLISDMHELVRDESVSDALRTFAESSKNRDVFILATANSTDPIQGAWFSENLIPLKIFVDRPGLSDSVEMIEHLLEEKQLVSKVSADDIANIFAMNTYSELDTCISNAVAHMSASGAEKLRREDVIREAERLNFKYRSGVKPVNKQKMLSRALHEAAHVVVGEILEPGIIGIAQILPTGDAIEGGCTCRNADWDDEIHHIAMSLAPLALPGLGYETDCYGSSGDIHKARENAVSLVAENGMRGLDRIALSDENEQYSEWYLQRQESAIVNLLDDKLEEAEKILADNREFLDAVADMICRKGSILASEIRLIKKKCGHGSVGKIKQAKE